MEHLFVVAHRISNGKYRPDAVYTERRVAENHKEILNIQDTDPKWEYFVLEGNTLPDDVETTESF